MSGNPPKKIKPRAGQRLARISHHFLSDPDNTTHHKLIIAESHEQPFPSAALAIQLACLGVHCQIHHPSQATTSIKAHELTTRRTKCPVNIHLHLHYNASAIKNTEVYSLLLPTQATAQGLRHSFMQLKSFQHSGRLDRIGITIMACNNAVLAEHFFTALYSACQRFLGQDICKKISSYGLLDNDPIIDNSSELSGIAQLIANDYCPLSAQQPFNTAKEPLPSTTKNYEVT